MINHKIYYRVTTKTYFLYYFPISFRYQYIQICQNILKAGAGNDLACRQLKIFSGPDEWL